MSTDFVGGYPETQQLYHLNERSNWYINGFWHNWDYTHILTQLQSELVYNPWGDEEFVALQAEIRRCNGVAVHIRLNDYSGSERDILPTSNYYADALKYVLDEIANPVLYLFLMNRIGPLSICKQPLLVSRLKP